jgi:small subunit ribosomal protein S15e
VFLGRGGRLPLAQLQQRACYVAHQQAGSFLRCWTRRRAQASDHEETQEQERERKPFRRFFYRGLEVHTLLDLSHKELMDLLHSRARRRFARGHVPMQLIRRLRAAKKEATDGKPEIVKTHLRNMIVVPEMVGSLIGVYNGQAFTQVEVKVSDASRRRTLRTKPRRVRGGRGRDRARLRSPT